MSEPLTLTMRCTRKERCQAHLTGVIETNKAVSYNHFILSFPEEIETGLVGGAEYDVTFTRRPAAPAPVQAQAQ